MNIKSCRTEKILTVELTEREVIILRSLLTGAEVTETMQRTALCESSAMGSRPVEDDDLTDLYGSLGIALRYAHAPEGGR